MNEHSLDKRIAKLRAKRIGNESIAGIGAGLPAEIIRIKSNNEQNAEYRKPGYYLFLCFHGKNKFTPCVACRRSQRDADRNMDEFYRSLKTI